MGQPQQTAYARGIVDGERAFTCKAGGRTSVGGWQPRALQRGLSLYVMCASGVGVL